MAHLRPKRTLKVRRMRDSLKGLLEQSDSEVVCPSLKLSYSVPMEVCDVIADMSVSMHEWNEDLSSEWTISEEGRVAAITTRPDTPDYSYLGSMEQRVLVCELPPNESSVSVSIRLSIVRGGFDLAFLDDSRIIKKESSLNVTMDHQGWITIREGSLTKTQIQLFKSQPKRIADDDVIDSEIDFITNQVKFTMRCDQNGQISSREVSIPDCSHFAYFCVRANKFGFKVELLS